MVNLNWENKKNSPSLKKFLKEKDSIKFNIVDDFLFPFNEKFPQDNEFNQQIFKDKIIELLEDQFKYQNLLFLGDNELVLTSLLKELIGKIDLIYFDPPFGTGSQFNYKIMIGEGDNSKKSKFWIRKQAYNDKWSEGLDSYLSFMYTRLLLMKELLAETGSIYIHLDWHVSHYVKLILDEIFGIKNFRNEIIWPYPAASVQTKRFFVRSYDVILFYTKSDDYVFNDDANTYMEYSDRVKNALQKDDKGVFYYRGGSHDGKKLSQKVYMDKTGIFPRDFWSDIPYIRANTAEYQGFSTQKPERLLKRIILASTKEGDLVADFFCGSGTTLAVAEKLNRRWIGSDITNHAIHITKKRILQISESNDILNWKTKYNLPPKPFIISKSENKPEKIRIPKEFLKKGKIPDLYLDKGDYPSLNTKLERVDSLVTISLLDYDIKFKNILSEKVLNHIESFSDWIDFWSIDFDYYKNHFKNMWIDYRTPKTRALKLKSSPFVYTAPGTYTIMTKVIDIFGIETQKKTEIEIK